ncbi:MAG: class I SAM-dependent methyltransferase [Chitinivibrionales bacterium]|nr:class I SAM-dependent methyltransferase [Chitinivibrionales bacterium]
MNTTNPSDDYFDYLIKESQKPFSGWDFSFFYITERMSFFPLSWNYTGKILEKLRKSDYLLDMGTGGGEYLSTFQSLPKETYATECYQPNVAIAQNRLQPLGIKVIGLESHENLPFADGFFDMVINRHDSYREDELKRVMKRKGIFITQQVGGKNNIQINEDLNTEYMNEEHDWQLQKAVENLIGAGFKIIEKKEEYPINRFYDIGALIYYLKAIPWQIGDFTVEKYLDALKRIHETIQKSGYYDVASHRFLIVAVKE